LNKLKLIAMATPIELSQPYFTGIIYARRATNPENWAKIGRVYFEIIGLERIVKPEALSAIRIIKSGAIP